MERVERKSGVIQIKVEVIAGRPLHVVEIWRDNGWVCLGGSGEGVIRIIGVDKERWNNPHWTEIGGRVVAKRPKQKLQKVT